MSEEDPLLHEGRFTDIVGTARPSVTGWDIGDRKHLDRHIRQDRNHEPSISIVTLVSETRSAQRDRSRLALSQTEHPGGPGFADDRLWHLRVRCISDFKEKQIFVSLSRIMRFAYSSFLVFIWSKYC